ncbi:hypothetical protein AMECASPLE_038819 [Ameca splendens]|uniref:Secreted protein n=1 Tax=Ameca splendens TaxID=208324 RepID=A0ABV0XXD1_9TELE
MLTFESRCTVGANSILLLFLSRPNECAKHDSISFSHLQVMRHCQRVETFLLHLKYGKYLISVFHRINHRKETMTQTPPILLYPHCRFHLGLLISYGERSPCECLNNECAV